MIVWIWIVVTVGVLSLWLKKKYSFFSDRGVNSPPVVPIFGNLFKSLTRQEHISTATSKSYKAFPNDRFIGTYELTTPVVIVRDPELLKNIGVKDFEHFVDHRSISNENDPIFGKSLLGLKGDNWKDMRSTLSPAFTGSKLRNMVPLILESNKDLVNYLKNEIQQNAGKLDVDTEALLTRYTNDVIANCAFGLKTNSIIEKENQFFTMVTKLTNFNIRQLLFIFFSSTFPILKKLKKESIFNKEAIKYLGNVVRSAISTRYENDAFRPDVIQLLVEAKKGILKHENINDEKDAGFATVEESTIGKNSIKRAWTDDDLISQAFLFLLAGFDTVGSCMKLLLLELAINPDVQDKLRKEIDEFYEMFGDNMDYEKINQMKYLDMCVTETLRKWPPAQTTDRLCIRSYNMGKPNNKAEKDFILEKGMAVLIPIMALHHDPKYYPNPDKFDPERFSNENKHKINPLTYCPFGIGPRNCIGSRFALIEVKAMTFAVIRNFEVSPAPQTILPPRLDKMRVNTKLEGGHWLSFTNRA